MQEINEELPTLAQMYEHLWTEVRVHRNKLLKEADIQINLAEDTTADATPWRNYRQALRDLPGTTDNPTTVVWPTKPI
jgi:hypothetical protein